MCWLLLTSERLDGVGLLTIPTVVYVQVLDGGLSSIHVPYSYGFSIILLTVLVKLGTFPLTRQQVI